jgi:hypothetical protein
MSNNYLGKNPTEQFYFCEIYKTEKQAKECVDRIMIEYLKTIGQEKVANAFEIAKLKINNRYLIRDKY